MNGENPLRKPHHPLRILLIVLATIIAVVLASGFAAGPILKRYINDRLAKIPDYTGRVDGVAVSLFRGKYTLEDVKLIQRGHENEPPLVELNEMDVDLDYHALYHGQIAAGIKIEGANLSIVAPQPSPAPPVQQKAQRGSDILSSLVPIEISNLKVTNSKIHYVNPNQNPLIDVTVGIIDLTATGLTNQPARDTGVFPAKLTMKATTTGNGAMTASTEFDPLAAEPHFIIRVRVSHLNLPDFNPFLLAYTDADVAKGSLDLELEMQADRGAYSGYAKPFFKELNFKRPSDASRPLGQRIAKKAVAAAAAVLRNRQGKVATTAPFQGNFDKGGVQVWRTIVGLLKNAFIQALKEGFEGKLPPVPAETQQATTQATTAAK